LNGGDKAPRLQGEAMKPKMPEDNFFTHYPRKLRRWWGDFYSSAKNFKMPIGALNKFRIFSSAHNENWRKNHPRSEKKYGHKKD